MILLIIVLIIISVLILLFLLDKKVGAPQNNTNTTSSNTQKQTNKATTKKEIVFDKSKYSIDNPISIWVVVDKKRPLVPMTYAPTDLISVGNGQVMRNESASAFAQMIADAKKVGYTLLAESGYRSYSTQVSVYGNEVKNFGQITADTESARPGYSEHQTGWAIDIASPGCAEDCFGKTMASKWLLANAYKYGFFERYPANKTNITGYRNEPWHFRYVGKELALEIQKTGQTLEEFFGLSPAPTY